MSGEGCSSADLTLQDSQKPLLGRVLWIALLSNFAMFIVEFWASLEGNSIALQADAFDFFSDSVNYGISLFVLGMALRHRAYAALVKGFMMAILGLWVITNAIERAIAGSEPDPLTMGTIAILALVVNVGVAVMLYRYRGGDSNLRSVWLCSRNDAIGNLAVILAGTVVFASGTRWPDLLVATLIAWLSLSAAGQIIRQAVMELHSSALSEHEPGTSSGAQNQRS